MECVAGLDDSRMLTFPMLLNGDTLKLDADARGGRITASVEKFDGSVAEGFARDDATDLTGEFVEGEIHFKGGSLRQFGDQPVRIVVHMTRDARLYALGVL